MTKKPRLEVVKESKTGLNQQFRDSKTGEILNRGEVAKRIDEFPDYHVMNRDGKNIIRSNPDKNGKNNLG